MLTGTSPSASNGRESIEKPTLEPPTKMTRGEAAVRSRSCLSSVAAM